MRRRRYGGRLRAVLFRAAVADVVQIGKGNVPGYDGGEDPIVHLVTSAEAVVEADLRFAFTDGHSTMRFTELFRRSWGLVEG